MNERGRTTFSLIPDQRRIQEAIEQLCERFGDYWLRKDSEGGFPEDFQRRSGS